MLREGRQWSYSQPCFPMVPADVDSPEFCLGLQTLLSLKLATSLSASSLLPSALGIPTESICDSEALVPHSLLSLPKCTTKSLTEKDLQQMGSRLHPGCRGQSYLLPPLA